jgi:hypothetical protein
LFETETALEHGGRFLEALLAEEAYRDYVRGRGRVSIQTGFSDAGRFIGQLPAALAIERLQGRWPKPWSTTAWPMWRRWCSTRMANPWGAGRIRPALPIA